MREIKFRGKPKSGYNYSKDGWMYGSLVNLGDNNYGIIELSDITFDSDGAIDYCHVPVRHDAIGQFTGLKDRNGTEIYEGDIAKGKSGLVYEIRWDKVSEESVSNIDKIRDLFQYTGFCIYHHKYNKARHLDIPEDYEVIGNIHDNPELLK